MRLQTASIILAILHIVSVLISIITLSIQISNLDESSDNVPLQAGVAKWFVFIAVLGFCLVSGGFAALMIYGSMNKIPGYVFPFIAIGFTNVVLSVGVCVPCSFVLACFIPFSLFLLYSALIYIPIGLGVYFWLILYSHYHELMAEKFGGGVSKSGDGKVFSQPMNPYSNI